MNVSKTAVIIDSVLGKVFTFIGYIVGAFFLLGFLIMITDSDTMTSSDKTAGIVVCIFFIVVAGILIFQGTRLRNRIKRFKTYVALLSEKRITSLDIIAASTSKSTDFVRNDLQKMFNKKFFINAYIDKNSNEIVINNKTIQNPAPTQPIQNSSSVSETESVRCSGCGAINLKQKEQTTVCEYCGSPLK